ncbi:MAG: leucyl aminopeptidase [Deltaproteobacteria bacterium]|nr:leucyl aminopeptidase [Deltaproteobacteria bacterium]
MKITLTDDAPHSLTADVLAVPVLEGALDDDPIVRALDAKLGGTLVAAAKAEEFVGKVDQAVAVNGAKGVGARRVVLYGLGRPSTLGRSEARAFAVRASRGNGITKLAIVAPSSDDDAYQGIAEGVGLGAYRYTRYLTGDRLPKKTLGEVTIASRTGKVAGKGAAKANAGHKAAVERGTVVADAVTWTRDWVNGPPNDVNALTLTAEAKRLAHAHGLTCTALDKAALAKKRMDLLLAVNKGSAIEPRLIHLKHAPKKARGRVVFVGKGITFDSGGLCIKSAKQMADMKCDMAGAALTIATLVAAARLDLPVEVHGICAITENMTGPEAYRPGDVYKSYEGKSVEIINTDAEGRLILADALAYAAEQKPDVIVDHATLTGACMVALGPYTAGIYANDDAFGSAYVQAAGRAGESVWRMPLLEELRDGLKSDVADLKHTGEQYGGSITAALFLREFVRDAKWIHLDIAGPAFLERAQGIAPKGATGFGVLAALRFLEDYDRR